MSRSIDADVMIARPAPAPRGSRVRGAGSNLRALGVTPCNSPASPWDALPALGDPGGAGDAHDILCAARRAARCLASPPSASLPQATGCAALDRARWAVGGRRLIGASRGSEEGGEGARWAASWSRGAWCGVLARVLSAWSLGCAAWCELRPLHRWRWRASPLAPLGSALRACPHRPGAAAARNGTRPRALRTARAAAEVPPRTHKREASRLIRRLPPQDRCREGSPRQAPGPAIAEPACSRSSNRARCRRRRTRCSRCGTGRFYGPPARRPAGRAGRCGSGARRGAAPPPHRCPCPRRRRPLIARADLLRQLRV
jgi:hypothetical protein